MRKYIDINLGKRSVTNRELPSFFLDEPLPPTDKIARLRDSEVNAAMQNLLDVHSG